jgi:hypothetical protein
MAMIVPCPKCGARLSAPDDAAGKKLRCPKPGCGALAEVPLYVAAEEVAVVDAVAVTPMRPEAEEEDDQPRKKPRRDEEDDETDGQSRKRRRRDDDDYEWEHTRRKRRKSGLGAGAVTAIVLGGLVLVAGAGLGIYALVGGADGGLFGAKKSPPPAGWTEYTYASDGFKAYFPSRPAATSAPAGFGAFGGVSGLSIPGVAVPQSVTFYLPGEIGAGTHVVVIVLKYTAAPAPTAQRRLIDGFLNQNNRAQHDVTTVRWLGVDAVQSESRLGLARMAFVGSTLYIAEISSGQNGRAAGAEESGFFDHFELIN